MSSNSTYIFLWSFPRLPTIASIYRTLPYILPRARPHNPTRPQTSSRRCALIRTLYSALRTAKQTATKECLHTAFVPDVSWRSLCSKESSREKREERERERGSTSGLESASPSRDSRHTRFVYAAAPKTTSYIYIYARAPLNGGIFRAGVLTGRDRRIGPMVFRKRAYSPRLRRFVIIIRRVRGVAIYWWDCGREVFWPVRCGWQLSRGRASFFTEMTSE